MRKLLVAAAEAGELIAFYVHKEDTEAFVVGRIVFVGKNSILAVLYDTRSLPEAFCYCDVDAIYRIEQDSLYLRNMQPSQYVEFVFSKLPDTAWDSFFQIQSQYGNIVRCHLKSGKSLDGKVIQHFQDTVILSQTTSNSLAAREFRFDRSEVAMLTLDITNGGV